MKLGKKTRLNYMLPTRNTLWIYGKHTNRLKVERWKRYSAQRWVAGIKKI